jgi:alcohol dehydrogenase (cytochrome c)
VNRHGGNRLLVTASIVCAVCAWIARVFPMAASQELTVSNAVYTSDQASRGEEAYNQQCASCHKGDLSGGEYAPALTAAVFEYRWTNKTLDDLFQKIVTTMPQDKPGALDKGTYTDILTYILKANGYPAGQTPLDNKPVTLKNIRIAKTP